MINRAFWTGKNVLVTGNTGFKGSWLSLWLSHLGANVQGFSLEPPTSPSLFEAAKIGERVPTMHGDVRDYAAVQAKFDQQQPEIVFHMAAQPLVRRSYADPIGTYATNVMGTVHVLEGARHTPGVRAVVNVTSDKCYENREQTQGYRESDPMGGHDPYSSSKGCAELVSAAYRRSYFEHTESGQGVALATVRAGNVIGGGDWAEDRLVPDCMRALMSGKPIVIRNPEAVRPWQHVMEPLAGYLLTAERLWEDPTKYRGSYNFGPGDQDVQPVSFVVRKMVESWGEGSWKVQSDEGLHESRLLSLDSSLAQRKLDWHPRLRLSEALEMTVTWYRQFQAGNDMASFSLRQIEDYQKSSRLKSDQGRMRTRIETAPQNRG